MGQTVTVPTGIGNSVYDKNRTKTGEVQEYGNAHGENVLPLKLEPTPERLNALFSKLDLSGIEEWSEDNQQKVHDLMVKYQHLFALSMI